MSYTDTAKLEAFQAAIVSHNIRAKQNMTDHFLNESDCKKEIEIKYLYKCFCRDDEHGCQNNKRDYLKFAYRPEYGFIFSVSEHIKELEDLSNKTNIARAKLLKGLVHDLFKTNLSEVSNTISHFQEKHFKQLGWGLFFPSKTWKFLNTMANGTRNLNGKSFEEKVSNKVLGSDLIPTVKKTHIDPLVNECVADANVKEFQQLIKDRVAEENEKLSKQRSFFTKVRHFFAPTQKANYFAPVKQLKLKLQKYEKFSSTKEMAVLEKVGLEGNDFGDTSIGQKLSSIWNGFKNALTSATKFLEKPKNKLSGEPKKVCENTKPKVQHSTEFLIKKVNPVVRHESNDVPKKKVTTEAKYNANVNNVKTSNSTRTMLPKFSVGKKNTKIYDDKKSQQHEKKIPNNKKIIKQSTNNKTQLVELWNQSELSERQYNKLRLFVSQNETKGGNEFETFRRAYIIQQGLDGKTVYRKKM